MSANHKVLLFYSSEDEILANRFTAAIRQHGLGVRNITEANSSVRDICAIVLLTENTWHSEDVMRQVINSKKHNHHLIVIMYSMAASEAPSRYAMDTLLRGVHTIDAENQTEPQMLHELRARIRLLIKPKATRDLNMSITLKMKSAMVVALLTFAVTAISMTFLLSRSHPPEEHISVDPMEKDKPVPEPTLKPKPASESKEKQKAKVASTVKMLAQMKQQAASNLTDGSELGPEDRNAIQINKNTGDSKINMETFKNLGSLSDQLDAASIKKLIALRKLLAEEASLEDMEAIFGRLTTEQGRFDYGLSSNNVDNPEDMKLMMAADPLRKFTPRGLTPLNGMTAIWLNRHSGTSSELSLWHQ